ncbi:class I SAM-dependent methyltransferase [Herpetosiphon sp. NSE202]|uniref:class I SAM-dependent methyltransferase n=1 Tax=Herpetosiphon sp. NSE202 TaxID=3351349 RepID=UPI003628ECD3
MVGRELYRLLQCPTCNSRDLAVYAEHVLCAGCRNEYPIHKGYIDLMPRQTEFDYISKYVSEEESMGEELDYREMAPPLLAAGVRHRQIRRMLALKPTDIVFDNACGNGRFGLWNADAVGLIVGSDPAVLFADQALAEMELAQADSRRLPFVDGAFDKSLSVDVLEHFPRDVIHDYLVETARVLRVGGRVAIFSNTREMSPIQPIINISKRLGKFFVKQGVYDFEREARRKSDHIKDLKTWDDVEAALVEAGLKPVKVVFWNSVFTSFVEHVLMKLGESLIAKRKAAKSASAPVLTDEAVNASAGAQREIVARRAMRRHLTKSSPIYWALYLVTLLMELDLWLFGWMRTGPYFVLAEKVEGRYVPAPLPTEE